MAMTGRGVGQRFFFAATLLLLMAPTLFFFFWMISLSLKTDVDNLAYPPVLIPREFTLSNYAYVFANSPLPRFAINSVVVAVGSTGLALLLGVPAGYGIARSRRYGTALLILVARMTPALSYLIPWFLLFQQLGLANTYHALILTHLIIGLPLVIWVMIGFFEGVQQELEDAALIDGCSRFGSFLRVAVPLTRAGIVVSGILAFIFSWNNFIFAVVLAGPRLQTLPVAVFSMMSFEQTNWGPLAAAALLITAPVLVLTLTVQRDIVAGLAAGGMKG
jgi:multiple sugar transport system permease protein